MLNQPLEGLIERVEKATEGSRELDAEIAAFIRWHPYGPDHWLNRSPEIEFRAIQGQVHMLAPDGQEYCNVLPPEYTRSIDAALGFAERVLPGAFYHIAKGRLTEAEPLFGAELLFGWDQSLGTGEGPTAPLAIILATLRAIQSSKTGDAA